MPLRFRKTIKLLPGVRLNIGKTGVSTSFGEPGATVNVRGRRVKGTVGLPGSGLSWSEETTLPGARPGPAKRLGIHLLSRFFDGLAGRDR